MTLDLFIANPDNWGWQLCFRTGSAGFNEHMMIPALKARGYLSEKGHIQRDGQIIPTPEETDLWSLSKLPWLEPRARGV